MILFYLFGEGIENAAKLGLRDKPLILVEHCQG